MLVKEMAQNFTFVSCYLNLFSICVKASNTCTGASKGQKKCMAEWGTVSYCRCKLKMYVFCHTLSHNRNKIVCGKA